MTETERPKWTHQTPEPLARWLTSHRVTKITHHWEFTGVDTSRDWITVHADKGTRDLPSGFFRDNQEFQFSPDHAGLIRESSYVKVRDTIQQIDRWEKANASDRSEFERLKKKFA